MRKLLFGFLAAVGLAAAPVQAQDIVVGGGFVLSGPIAAYGEDAKIGVDLAVEVLNAKGGINGRRIRVDYEDTGADRAKAVAIYRKYAARPEVVAMLSISSIEFVALDPVANDVKLPIVSVGSAAPMAKFSDWSFRIQLIVNKAMGPVLTELKSRRGYKSVAVIFDTANNYNVGEMQSVKDAAAGAGYEFKGTESFSTNEQNFTLQLTRIAQMNPDLLYVAATTNEAALIVNQARALGVKAAIIGGAGLNDNRVASLPGKAAHGIMTFFPFDAQDARPVVQEFVAKYREKHKKDVPPAYVALGYDALMLVADAVRRSSPTDRDAIRKAIGQTRDLQGANGAFTYSGSGDNQIQKPNIFVFGDKGFARIDR